MNRQTPVPLVVPRTRRNHGVAVLSSIPAGKFVPIGAFPMLREDQLSGAIDIQCEMLETRELLMNPVTLRVRAYCVPLLALERFEGSRDQFDRSYKGEPQIEGGDVVPFIETAAAGTHGSNLIYKYLGLHAKSTDNVNTAYNEAYNVLWNFLAKNRSLDITPRGRLDNATLAPAFWQHSRFANIVPSFDQAVIDGQVALNVVDSALALSANAAAVVRKNAAANAGLFRGTGGNVLGANGALSLTGGAGVVTNGVANLSYDPNGTLEATLAGITAELSENGITVSLSNLEMARKTQAFAKLRQRYEGIDDEYIIDMLMDGLSIPEMALKQPILLADQTVRFRQAKRYATDAANLAESAVSGGAALSLRYRVPRLPVGGIVMIVAECLPEQLWERQRDWFLHSADVANWPEFVRDSLDPQKVDAIPNGEIDTAHSTPTTVFGYAPMNWRYNAAGPKVGGKFYRPTSDAPTDDDRMRLWAVEGSDPVLSEDFYIVNSMHTKPFLDTEVDPFEVTMTGNNVIVGNTVFGGVLVEATGNYDAVAAKAPTDQIDQDA